MPKLTFLGLAEKVLREENRPLSPSEIWKVALAKGYDKELESTGKTPDRSLYSLIFLNERDRSDTVFKKVGQRPARYFLRELVGAAENLGESADAADNAPADRHEYSEADLHPFLTRFARVSFKAYTKTIRHSTSKKKEYGEWVHPDVIGVYYAVEDWTRSVLDLSAATGNAAIKL